MGRGENILYGDIVLKKEKTMPEQKPVPRLEELAQDIESLGLEEWIESVDGWSGGHYWIVRKEELPLDWKEGGMRINEPRDFMSLIARAEAHLSALGKTETISFSSDVGGQERALPMRDVFLEGQMTRYVNANYLEGAIRALGHEPERWHLASLHSREKIIGYDGEEPVIIIAPAR